MNKIKHKNTNCPACRPGAPKNLACSVARQRDIKLVLSLKNGMEAAIAAQLRGEGPDEAFRKAQFE